MHMLTSSLEGFLCLSLRNHAVYVTRVMHWLLDAKQPTYVVAARDECAYPDPTVPCTFRCSTAEARQNVILLLNKGEEGSVRALAAAGPIGVLAGVGLIVAFE